MSYISVCIPTTVEDINESFTCPKVWHFCMRWYNSQLISELQRKENHTFNEVVKIKMIFYYYIPIKHIAEFHRGIVGELTDWEIIMYLFIERLINPVLHSFLCKLCETTDNFLLYVFYVLLFAKIGIVRTLLLKVNSVANEVYQHCSSFQ